MDMRREIMVGESRGVVRRVGLEEIVDLRHVMLRQGLPREAAVFPGDEVATNYHFGAFVDGGRNVGCATFHFSEWQGEPAWRLRGMATLSGFQKHGVGRAVLSFAEEMIGAESAVRLLWCDARTPAVAFYERQGWRVVSEEFFIPTAGPHFKMIKGLGGGGAR
jgi:GNAT superfamily N-acetyltransferase